MRASSWLNPTAFMSRRLLSVLSISASLTNALQFKSVTQPSLDLSDLGRVGLAGDFSGISLYEWEGQSESSPFSNGSQSLLTQLPNGVFTVLASADAEIQAMCVHELSNGVVKGIIVGGNFTSLGNVAANGVALFNPDDGSITALKGIDGKVSALLCDKESSSVYVGGDFSGEDNASNNAIVWVDGDGWTNLPFQGFHNPVDTIVKSPNNTIIFGGSLDNLGNSSTPQVKNAQTINLVSTDITAEQTTDLAGFNDPKKIVCSNGTDNQWLLQDGRAGSWTANFKFEFKPTKLRLRNSKYQGRGTKVFRFRAFPIDGIMNLTYIDPATNSTTHCDAWCPLSNDLDFQDFLFVNEIGMSEFRIDILDFYGAGGGLAGVDLFQDEIFSFASTDLNEPKCAASPAKSSSVVTGSAWTKTSGPEVDSEYLSANLNAAQLNSAFIVFEPHIQQSGEYEVLVYTPGCRQDSTCGTRGEVNITASFTKDGLPPDPTQFFQTNDFNKYDVVYRGMVDAASDSFRPSVTLTPTTSQSLAVVNIVAQKVQFKLFNAKGGSATSTSSSTTSDPDTLSSSKLNGLYEYDPSKNETTSIENSIISTTGLKLKTGARVTSIVVKDALTYVAGNFTALDNSFSHFFSIDSKGPVSLAQGGLDGPVYVMTRVDDLLYLGGTFGNTKSAGTSGLGFLAAYNTVNNEWQALGAGVNGRVKEIVPMSLNLTSGAQKVIAISGDFTSIKADNDNNTPVQVAGFAVWVPSQRKWLQRMPEETVNIGGILSASVDVPNSNMVFSGSVSSNSMAASGAVTLNSAKQVQLRPLAMHFNNTAGSALKKRATVKQDFAGVVTGVFYESGNQNWTILGGHFTAQGKDGDIHNLAMINGAAKDEVTGPGSQLDSSSTIMALHVVGSLLFIGGSIEGTVNSNVSGLAIWDLANHQFINDQPPGLQGNAVEVHAISARPESSEVYVAGAFSSAGSLPCASLCIFDNQARQWDSVGGDISGEINVIHWIDVETLLVGGNMVINKTATYLSVYNAKFSQWEPFDADLSTIPGPIGSIALDSATIDTLFISGAAKDGSPYVMKLANKKFQPLKVDFGTTTSIRNIQVLPTQGVHTPNNDLQDDHCLLVTGNLDIKPFGNTSAVIYDGNKWQPFLLTSKSNADPGTISALFSQRAQSFKRKGKKLAKGFVILISLAIALALVFLLVVLGVLASYIRRRREGYQPAPTSATSGMEKSTSLQDRLPPSSLFSSMGMHGGRQGGGHSPML